MSEIVESIENYGLSKKDKPKTLFSKVGIVGCGLVGQNITKMISRKGIEVVFIELSEEKIKRAIKKIEKELDVMIEHWGMTASEKRAVLSRIHGYVGYEHLKGCDLVIEITRSKTKDDKIKSRKKIFQEIEKHVNQNTIIATNSSTVAITELSSDLKYNERCVNLHFSTASPDSKLIEVVRGLNTSDEVYENVKKFIKLIGKIEIPVEESPGLVSVRLFVAMFREACAVLTEGVAKIEDIDLTMRIGIGLTLGPFEMADKIGLDKVVRWMDNLHSEFGDIKYKAPPVIKKLVRAKHYGRITGKGFYKYDENGKKK
ncbi:MAG: 3-hydroxyacyl-CoA dehydrogenase family protein [Bacteroidales bacterium]|nr:3-hydroxyacyl-CoA dehydrogenase family protein [Bacteroidales bacterium]